MFKIRWAVDPRNEAICMYIVYDILVVSGSGSGYEVNSQSRFSPIPRLLLPMQSHSKTSELQCPPHSCFPSCERSYEGKPG